MPELPEVETVKRRLSQVLPGKTINQVQVLRSKSFRGQPEEIEQLTIKSLRRKAKLIAIELSNQRSLLIHLKMTGQLIYVADGRKLGGGHPTADWVHDLPGDHTRVVFTFEDGSHLYFNDMRVFGWIKLVSPQELKSELNKYGPDVIDQDFTPQYLQEKLKNRTIAIKQAIMIGQIVGGVGNIYASEALFEARIDPRRPANQLSSAEYQRLVTVLRQVIEDGIEAGGTTFDGKYVNVDGLAGNYQQQLKVYGREGEACPACQGEIKKVQISGRGTYFCPKCQH
jgi:formamidopyrimidine-DNA glycosylase